MALALAGALAHAGAFVDVDLAPLGRGDLAWNDSGQQSGTLVAESDGILVSPLRSTVGWTQGRWTVGGGLSAARLATFTSASESKRSYVRMAVRPVIEFRRWLMEPATGAPLIALHGRLHGVFPATSTAEDDATDDEQETIESQAAEDAGRIRSLGATLGFGVLYRWSSGLGVGAKSSVVYARSARTDTETVTVSSRLQPETTLTLSFWF